MHRPLRVLTLFIIAAVATGTGGCYYSHLASGQLEILWAREPIARVLDDPDLDEQTRALLQIVPAVREYAKRLGLDVGNQYTSYVEWPEDRIITTLVRTRPRSIEATPYWFPIVGHLPYKGYFDRDWAEQEAERLREAEDFDVCVSGVDAYSTLGWLDDPVTQPMTRHGPGRLVETLLHELVHATAFVSDDIDFNESVALFIGQEAAVQFFSTHPSPSSDEPRDPSSPRALSTQETQDWPDANQVRGAVEDRRLIAHETDAFRERLAALAAADSSSDRLRAQAEEEARSRLARLPLRVLDAEEVAAQSRLNDACIALRGTYTQDLPRHVAVLASLDGDLEAMVRRLVEVADATRTPAEFYDIDDLADAPATAAAAEIAEVGDEATGLEASVPDQLDDAFGDEASKDL
jgi:predicted aminopeptidase